MYIHQTKLSSMTAAWLLPIVAPIVASASGGIVAQVLPDPEQALMTIIVSYVLWGTGVPLAMAVLVMYFHRLTVYKLPAREVIVSVFLPLGPLGQGGFAIMQLGKVAITVFPQLSTLDEQVTGSGKILYTMGWLIAIIMWGFGLVWFFFALASISRSRFPFNMGWWGFVFPLGVFTVAATTLGQEVPSAFFRVLGTVCLGPSVCLMLTSVSSRLLTLLMTNHFQIFSVIVTLLWLIVTAGTVRKASTGELFFAPCLKDLEGMEARAAQHFGDSIT